MIAAMTPPAPNKVLAHLWRAAGQPEAGLEAITLAGAEPALPSSFAVGTVAQATAAASALAANELWHLRTGRRQRVSVDMRHAGIEFRSERYQAAARAPRQDGRGLSHRGRALDPAAHQPAASSRRHY